MVHYDKETLDRIGAEIDSSVIRAKTGSIGTILITGGDDVVGYRVALGLVAANYPHVRVGVPSNPSSSMEGLEQAGAKMVPFDWDREETYARALEGIKSVFITFPHHENWKHQFLTFLTTARKQGVRNFVKLSFVHSLISTADDMKPFSSTATHKEDVFQNVPMIVMHRECDTHIMKLPAPWYNYTLLFASHFMSNATVYQMRNIQEKGSFVGASHGHGVNYVSPNDIAEVAVRVLLNPKQHHRVGYNLTGPEAIHDQEIASILSKELHHPVTYEDKSLDDFPTLAQDTDWGPAIDVAYLEYAKASGYEENRKFISHDIDYICGHAAEKYKSYMARKYLMTPRELACLEEQSPMIARTTMMQTSIPPAARTQTTSTMATHTTSSSATMV